MLRFSVGRIPSSVRLLSKSSHVGTNRSHPVAYAANFSNTAITAEAGNNPSSAAAEILVTELQYKMSQIRAFSKKKKEQSKSSAKANVSKVDMENKVKRTVSELVKLASECDKEAPLSPIALKDLLLSLNLSLDYTHKKLDVHGAALINRIVFNSLEAYNKVLQEEQDSGVVARKGKGNNPTLFEVVKGLSMFKMAVRNKSVVGEGNRKQWHIEPVLLQCLMRATHIGNNVDFNTFAGQQHLIQNTSKYLVANSRGSKPLPNHIKIQARHYAEDTLAILGTPDEVVRKDSEIQLILHTALARLKIASTAGVSVGMMRKDIREVLINRLLHLSYETGHHSTAYPGALLSRCLLTMSSLDMEWERCISPEVERGMFMYLKKLSTHEGDEKVPPMSALTATKMLFSLGRLQEKIKILNDPFLQTEVAQSLFRIALGLPPSRLAYGEGAEVAEEIAAKREQADRKEEERVAAERKKAVEDETDEKKKMKRTKDWIKADEMNRLNFLEAVEGFARMKSPIHGSDWDTLTRLCYQFIKRANADPTKGRVVDLSNAELLRNKQAHIIIWALGKIMQRSSTDTGNGVRIPTKLVKEIESVLLQSVRTLTRSRGGQNHKVGENAGASDLRLPLKVVPITLTTLHRLGISWRGTELGYDLDVAMTIVLDLTTMNRDITDILTYMAHEQPVTNLGYGDPKPYTLESMKPELRSSIFNAVKRLSNSIRFTEMQRINYHLQRLECNTITMTPEETTIMDNFSEVLQRRQVKHTEKCVAGNPYLNGYLNKKITRQDERDKKNARNTRGDSDSADDGDRN